VDKGDHFVLNGQKRFIVGGEGADYFLVYAKTDPDAEPRNGISCFIVDRTDGVETKYLYGLMGCRGGGAARMVFKDVKVPKENRVGGLNQGVKVFNTMMIPERLGTAAMTIGAAVPAVDIATGYTSKRKAFGRPVAQFQGVSFQVAEAVTLLDAARAMIYTTARAVDAGIHDKQIRRLVSESKKFVTESCQKAVHNAMQVMGGIGYTNIYPVERIFRDLRLASIWTGTNEVMAMIIANEWYKAYWKDKSAGKIRDMEEDAQESSAADEKIFE
jgi:alkylation response protein AidB-like acyl-CoA dehydrogenase